MPDDIDRLLDGSRKAEIIEALQDGEITDCLICFKKGDIWKWMSTGDSVWVIGMARMVERDAYNQLTEVADA